MYWSNHPLYVDGNLWDYGLDSNCEAGWCWRVSRVILCWWCWERGKLNPQEKFWDQPWFEPILSVDALSFIKKKILSVDALTTKPLGRYQSSSSIVLRPQLNSNWFFSFPYWLDRPLLSPCRHYQHNALIRLSIILIVSVFLTGMQVGYFLERAGRDYIIFGPNSWYVRTKISVVLVDNNYN